MSSGTDEQQQLGSEWKGWLGSRETGTRTSGRGKRAGETREY